ncbi:Inactive protein kinase [Carex littledalei]|uniref:Inactive protein kinase n=1 Tax=Carex littledalei TaxID=544730 RepID=A0A833QUF0_9POAL|nr:Inactive protein kinase [Carex littledalei]
MEPTHSKPEIEQNIMESLFNVNEEMHGYHEFTKVAQHNWELHPMAVSATRGRNLNVAAFEFSRGNRSHASCLSEKARHVNVVSLIGYCTENNARLCVFELCETEIWKDSPCECYSGLVVFGPDQPGNDHVDLDAETGTAGYANPDCYGAGPFVSQRTDVYSFGVVVLEMVTSQMAYNAGDMITCTWPLLQLRELLPEG